MRQVRISFGSLRRMSRAACGGLSVLLAAACCLCADAATGSQQPAVGDAPKSAAQDERRAARDAAERAFAEAERLRTARDAASLRRAVEKYEESLAHWEAASERALEARALHNIGYVYNSLGEKQRALDYYLRALKLRPDSDARGRGLTLGNIASAYNSLGRKQQALDYYRQLLALRREAGDSRGEAEALDQIASVYNTLGEHQKALEYLERKLRLQRAIPDRAGEATTLNNIASVYNSADERERALEYYSQALKLDRELGDRRREAVTLSNIGTAYSAAGDRRRAIEHYERALVINREVNDQRRVVVNLANLGLAYAALGERERAREHHEQALALARETNNRQWEVRALNSLGALHASAGEADKALDHHRRALALARTLSHQELAADSLFLLARTEQGRGELDAARAQIEAALALVEAQRASFAGPEVRASFFARTLGRYEFYIDLLMRMHRRDPAAGHAAAALAASERVRARTLLETLAESRAEIRRGVAPELVERERGLQQQLNARAEAQAQLLGGRHTEEEAAAARREIAALTTEYQELAAQIRASSPRYAALTEPQPLALAEIQRLLDADTLLLEYALGGERSWLWVVSPTALASFELPRRAEIEAAARRVYGLLTARQRVRGESERQRQERVTKAAAEYEAAAAGLSATLLGPAAALLGEKRLVIVADGALQYVPFAALPVPGDERSAGAATATSAEPLVARHEIVSLPSASVLAVLRREREGRKPAAGTVAVLADPVFDKDDDRVAAAAGARAKPSPAGAEAEAVETDEAGELRRATREAGLTEGLIPRLPFSRQEAEAILSLAPARSRMAALNFQANRRAATGAALSNYRIVHFATHGLLNAEHPELSGLVLSLVDERGRAQDGFLRLHEIYNLSLPSAELVVLSACQTGLGKEVRGEGLVGLVRGFMYAGAPRVAASLWKVDDWATAEMMRHFYRGLLQEKLRPAEALRRAQAAMWKQRRWQPPYYWAGFVLQGDWK